MPAQILFGEEVEDLAARVSDAVVGLLADLSSELTDASHRTAVSELVITAREHLARQPVDPAPMVRAILHKDLVGRWLSPDGVDGHGIALAPAVVKIAVLGPPRVAPVPVSGFGAPSYWPAVPAISSP
jgi:hypothetical protein